MMISRLLFPILTLAAAWCCAAGEAASPAARELERSYWLHASLATLPQKGYWGPGFPACEPPQDGEIRNAARLLTGPGGANRLYLVYHHEISLSEAEAAFSSWRRHSPVSIVPTLVLRMYDSAQTEVFTPAERQRLTDFFRQTLQCPELGIYDVYPARDQGASLVQIASLYPAGLVRLGIQPGEPVAPPFTAAVQDTWSGFCHGKTNADWLDRGFGAETLRRWVLARNQGPARVAWDLIAVAWDYSATERGGYPGYDDPSRNMPLPEGRNSLALQAIRTWAGPEHLAGFSSDLLILQANSRTPEHDGSNSFYQTLRKGEAYQGYYSGPLREIASLFQRLASE